MYMLGEALIMEKVAKYSDQFWINRYVILSFLEKVRCLKELEKKVINNPYDAALQNSLFNFNKEVNRDKPAIYADKTFYEVA